MTNRIYIANLGKYNEGIIQGDWFDFPVDMESVSDRIGLNQFYEEWAVHDYEFDFPIEIGEYPNLEKLNEFMERIEGIHGISELMDYLYDSSTKNEVNVWGRLAIDVLNELEIDHDIVTDDYVHKLATEQLEDGGWEGLKHLLSHANSRNEYHVLDGYGNIVELHHDDVKTVLSDYFNEQYRS